MRNRVPYPGQLVGEVPEDDLHCAHEGLRGDLQLHVRRRHQLDLGRELALVSGHALPQHLEVEGALLNGTASVARALAVGFRDQEDGE